jgi:hypothetical protein
VRTQTRSNGCKPVRGGACALLLALLASASCDRTKRTDDRSAETARPAQSSGLPVGAAEASLSPPVSVMEAEPVVSHCEPLARPPKTERRNLPSQGRYDARASYPYVLSSDAAVDEEANGVIAGDLASRRRAFTKDADEAMAEARGDRRALTPDQLALDIKCEEALATTTLLSIVCSCYTNLGGAYPNLDTFAYNFALCAGKGASYLTLAALCTPEAGCKRTILDLIRRKLAAKKIDVTLDENAEALKRFAITQTGLRFFANDDIPHAIASTGTIDIPFEMLRAVLSRDGPLAGLLAR